MSDVTDFFRRLWRLPETPHRRGRRSTLDVETVVSTAVRLADAGGLEAATLPKVADELGVTAMSLYRHVGSKHELLMLMMDAATEPPDHSSADAGWRDGLRQWAVDLWSLYLERPWIPHVPVHSPPSGPHQVAWLEQGLDRLSATGLDWGDQLMVLTTVSGFVRQSALLQQELEEGRAPGQSQAASERAYGEALLEVVRPESFPRTAAMLRSRALAESPDAAEHDFTQGLELFLDGLATRVSGDASATA